MLNEPPSIQFYKKPFLADYHETASLLVCVCFEMAHQQGPKRPREDADGGGG